MFAGRALAVGLLYATSDHRNRRLLPLFTPAVCQPLPDKYAITNVSPAVCFYSTATGTKPPELTNATQRPLALLLCWLMAEPKNINKYAELYLEQGYDVLTVRVRPWHMLWPNTCATVVLNEVLPALTASTHERKIVHGFSAGGFVFAQMLKSFKHEPEKYRKLISTFKAQIWDSVVVDVNGVSLGVSTAVYHNSGSESMQKALKAYVDFHLWFFYFASTKYYHEAGDYFHHQPIQVPALFMASKRDAISTLDQVQAVKQNWEKVGIPCTLKVWEDSDHVAHMKRYPQEYKSIVKAFLKSSSGNSGITSTTSRSKSNSEFGPSIGCATPTSSRR